MSKPNPIKLENKKYYAIIAANIRYFRTIRRMTQVQLGQATGVSSKYISLIESQNSRPSLEIVFDIARALNVHPVQIFRENT